MKENYGKIQDYSAYQFSNHEAWLHNKTDNKMLSCLLSYFPLPSRYERHGKS